MISRVSFRTAFFSVTKIVLMLMFSFCTTINANERFCPDQVSVDLTNATRNATGFLDRSGNFFPSEIVRNRDSAWHGCICDIKPCVLLCPTLKNVNKTEPEHFRNTSAEIPPVYMTNLTLEDDAGRSLEPEKRFHIFDWDPCADGLRYYLESDKDEKDQWYLLKNGSLFLPKEKDTETLIDWTRYCLRQRLNETTFTPRVCLVEEIQANVLKTATYFCGLLSVPFLLATIVIYSVLPELRNIHGNTFRCYLGCLLSTFIILAVDRIPVLTPKLETISCIPGFILYFSFTSSFLWLNIMCFDMWWEFGGYGSLQIGNEAHNRRKFIKYSVYGWGTATVLTAMCIGAEFSPGLSKSAIAPNFRQGSCWFTTLTAKVLFFLGPAAMTIFCNICFFISTAIRLIQHERDIQRQLSCADSIRHDDNKLTFILYLKLFVIMGISWSTEVISTIWEEPRYLWYATDIVNGLQGVFIFIIFVCKKKIWQSLRSRFKFFRKCNGGICASPRPSNSDSTVNSIRTASSSVSLDNSLPLDERKKI